MSADGFRKGHKGQRRHFITEDEVEANRLSDEKKLAWSMRNQNDLENTDAQDSGDNEKLSANDEGFDQDDLDTAEKHKGVSHLIETANPNLISQKPKKLSELSLEDTKVILTRKQREEIESQRESEKYAELLSEGKTPEAQADLARLAIIRKSREDAAKEAEDKKKATEEAKKLAAERSVMLNSKRQQKKKGKKK